MQPIFRVQSNLLYQRLEDALQQGLELRLVTQGDRFCGVPIALDEEFIEILYLHVSEDEDSPEEDPYARTVWVIRIAEILAVAYQQSWSRDKLAQLLPTDAATSEVEES
ncbi:MAG: hypothetical protein KME07_09145 [Pegethrix bostrychoides GSE-TBD4-15B]|jgi:hypothetical protein|uniref:Uncharacterized protein n=1 Tax=Pegethrix bostrychoides GSE-TBD4-15B TaxID=2839662 RepID=A0A951P9I4_9CYAN|nr:hypothetical protein [Pegethrix bostrychoides GSE-TBD4-15B]